MFELLFENIGMFRSALRFCAAIPIGVIHIKWLFFDESVLHGTPDSLNVRGFISANWSSII